MRFINKTLVPRSGIKHVSVVQGFVPSCLRLFLWERGWDDEAGGGSKEVSLLFRGPATSAGKSEAIWMLFASPEPGEMADGAHHPGRGSLWPDFGYLSCVVPQDVEKSPDLSMLSHPCCRTCPSPCTPAK